MKKIILSVLFICLGLIVLWGCSGKKEEKTQAKGKPAATANVGKVSVQKVKPQPAAGMQTQQPQAPSAPQAVQNPQPQAQPATESKAPAATEPQ